MEKNKKNFDYRFTATTAGSVFAMNYAFSSAAMAQEQQTQAVIEQPATPSGMTGIGDVGFAAPWMLAGALVLPLLWFLMRLTPPQPTSIKFPGTRLLRELAPKQETPDSLPWWHKMIRLGAASLVIAGLAGPILDPDEPIGGDGPVMLVVDNGWAAARNWEARAQEMNRVIDRAGQDGRPVFVLATAPPAEGGPVQVSAGLSPTEARALVKNLAPVPWAVDRVAALEALEAQAQRLPESAHIIWLSNGIDGEGTADFAARLREFGALTVREDAARDAARLLVPPAAAEGDLSVLVRRVHGDEADIVTLAASDQDGQLIDRQEVRFAAGETEARVNFDVPDELKRQMSRIDIEGENSAGASLLLDGQWRQRPVGLLANSHHGARPLGSEHNYIEAALSPYADMRSGTVDDLLARELAVMILPDSVALHGAARAQLEEWVRKGGTLLRFAGPNLAEGQDELLPVDLRDGSIRTMGAGGLSLNRPQAIAPFPEGSPFHGLELPQDVRIERQVLAEPSGDLESRTWARLADGTPLVTAEKRGQGQVVLVHTAATTQWSNLVLSGLFIDMLRAVIDQSEGVRGMPAAGANLPPWKIMDGFGRLQEPSGAAGALTAEAIRAGLVGPRTPPGIYGSDSGKRAHNLGPSVGTLAPLPAMPAGTERAVYVDSARNDLTGPLLAGALGLMLADLLIVLTNRRFRGLRQQPQAKPGVAGPA